MANALELLKKWASYKVGDKMPANWGPELTSDFHQAIAEMERLQDSNRSLLAVVKMFREVDDAYGIDLDESQRDQMHDAIRSA